MTDTWSLCPGAPVLGAKVVQYVLAGWCMVTCRIFQLPVCLLCRHSIYLQEPQNVQHSDTKWISSGKAGGLSLSLGFSCKVYIILVGNVIPLFWILTVIHGLISAGADGAGGDGTASDGAGGNM